MNVIIAKTGRILAYALSFAVLAILGMLAWFLLASGWREILSAGRGGEPGLYARAGGLDIHYQAWGPADGAPLLLIHGTMAWSGTWIDVGERLGARGFRVIAPDIPPFGYSERPADRGYSRKAQSRIILSFADALHLDRFVLAGHSFGAGATVEAAFTAPQRVKRLVLLDAALSLDNTGGSQWLARMFATPVAGRALAAATFTNPLMTARGLRDFIADDRIVTPERVAIYQKPLAVEGTSRAVADWLASALFGDESGSLAADMGNYRGFDRPTLLIWGRDDTVTPLAQAIHIKSLLPRALLLALPGVNHIPQVEDPDSVTHAIADFASAEEMENMALPPLLLRPALTVSR